MQLQRQSNKQLITLDPTSELSTGEEGRIYTVVQASPQEVRPVVAKVYHHPTDAHGRKLTAMFANPPQDPIATQEHVSIAWPVDLLRTVDDNGQIVGFLMPRVTGMRPVIDFYTPKTRRQRCPLFNYFDLHCTARNLAAAVHALHVRGYIIGDVNESNILVSDTGLVTLVGTDSFQVRDPQNGEVYRCPVGKPEFTPPELQGVNFADIDRGPEHDLFGLAVLIFQLLMEGRHPFAGIFQGRGDSLSCAERISAGHFPYSKGERVPYHPPPLALSFDILHPLLRDLFVRCFEDGHTNPHARPDAKTWRRALDEAEEALITCSVNEQHCYGNHLNDCPWCERAAQLGGLDPFPSQQAGQRGQYQQPVTPTRTSLSPTETQTATGGSGGFASPVGYITAAGVAFALLAFVPVLRLWAGMGAVVCGSLGWYFARDVAGRDRWMAGSAIGLGALMVALFLYSHGVLNLTPRSMLPATTSRPNPNGAVGDGKAPAEPSSAPSTPPVTQPTSRATPEEELSPTTTSTQPNQNTQPDGEPEILTQQHGQPEAKKVTEENELLPPTLVQPQRQKPTLDFKKGGGAQKPNLIFEEGARYR